MESSSRKTRNQSRWKMNSVHNISSMTSLGFHKMVNVPIRSSTSLTMHNMIACDPKLTALASIAEDVVNRKSWVSANIIR